MANRADIRNEDDHTAIAQRATRERKVHHWQILIVSSLVVVLAFALRTRTDQKVEFSFVRDLPAPELCLSQRVFGIPCPGCGLTRSFIHLAHGRWAESVRKHRVGWLLAIAVVLQLPYRIYLLRCIRQNRLEPQFTRYAPLFGWVLIIALIGNWVLLQFEQHVLAPL